MVRTLWFHHEGPGSIAGWGTKIPNATECSQKKKKTSQNMAFMLSLPLICCDGGNICILFFWKDSSPDYFSFHSDKSQNTP